MADRQKAVNATSMMSRRRRTTNISAPSAAENGSPARKEREMSAPQTGALTPARADQRMSGIQAKVVKLVSSRESVGPLIVSATAAISDASRDEKREKRR